MNSKVLVGILIAAIVGAALFGAGFWIARATTTPSALSWANWMTGAGGMMGGGMMGGAGMTLAPALRFGASAGVGGFGPLLSGAAEPLTVDAAREAVQSYLDRLDYADLEVGEIMIFDNHAYAEVVVKESGSGAFEVLVDPTSKAVFLEYGPAMMWNTEYGMMGSRGLGKMGGGMMVGGMMGGGYLTPGSPAVSAGDVTAEQAIEIAQEYLDQYLPGATADDEVDAFPGYFTVHTLKDGKILGMLSVNAYTGQVWVHTWHGAFVEMSE